MLPPRIARVRGSRYATVTVILAKIMVLVGTGIETEYHFLKVLEKLRSIVLKIQVSTIEQKTMSVIVNRAITDMHRYNEDGVHFWKST